MNWKKLLFPPVWVTVLLTLVSAAGLVTVFLKGWEETVPAYILYVLAFYTLSVICAYCAEVLPKRYRAVKQKLYENPLGNRYLTDRVFRSKVSLYLSLCVNLAYVGIHLLSWYLYRSWWFVVLAAYYGILSLMRFLLVGYVRHNAIGSSLVAEWKRSRICACILLLINLSLSGAVLMILYQNRGYEYHGILIYVMAAYTFYTTTTAIINLIRDRKLGSPVVTTTKVISLSAALVSMLSLETAMFSQFGKDMSVADQRLMIILTGAGVSIAVVTLSILLICRATKEIRSCENGKQ